MSAEEKGRLRADVIGVPGIVFMVVATIGPMAAVMGAAPLVFSSNGAGAVGAYVLSALLFAVFSVGYVAMSRHIGNAGGFVTYIARGFGPMAGGAASLVALLTYATFLAALYGIYAVFIQQTALDRLGIDLPWQVWALGTIVVVGALVYNRAEVNIGVMGVLLVAQVIVIAVLDVAIIFSGGEGGDAALSFAGLDPGTVFSGSVGLAFLFALASFGGFESTVVYSEEARDRRRTIPRATYLVVVIVGGFYAISTWALSNAVGTSRIQQVATEDPTGFIFAIAETYVGSLLADILSIVVVTSFFAIVLGFTNILGRYIFALARAGMLPAVLSMTHPRHQSPHVAALAASFVTAAIVGGFMLGGSDPFTTLYTWLLALGTVGVLGIFCATSLAVVAFFRRRPAGTEGAWHTLVAPLISAVGFVVAIWLALSNYDVLTAGQGGAARWLWVLVPIAAVVGYLIAARRGAHRLNFDEAIEAPSALDLNERAGASSSPVAPTGL